MARGLSRFWLWTAPVTVGIAAALVLAAGFVLALRGAAGDINATLCLSARERRTGTLSVSADLGSQPAARARRNV